jgi:hypothetical protein
MAKTAVRQRRAAAGASRTASTRQQRSTDADAAQQLVSACLLLLLEAKQQVGPHELSNCLLSLAVLCGSGGPAAGVMGNSQTASRTTSSSNSSSSLVSQSPQRQMASGSSSNGAVLQQLITPASSRALEQLLVAAAPQHQLQQLLDVTQATALPAAQQHQLVNMLYSLAVLRLRPAPHVLQQLLAHTQHHMQQLLSAHTDINSSSSSSSRWQGDWRTSKVLAQLLWASATLQLQLPPSWLQSYWAASKLLLPQFNAQDVSNVAWAVGALRLAPPAAWLSGLQGQAQAVAGSMSGQALANTLWGVAAVTPQRVRPGLLLQVLRCCTALGPGRLDGQNLANVTWAAARCLAAATSSSSSSSSDSWDERLIADARQQLQQLLSACQPLLPRLAPRDWSNMLWSCGLLQLQPGPEVLGQLWRKTPAGFSTSLNPHSSSGPTAWSPQGLANVLWGCARLGLRPPGVWLQGYEAAAVLLLPQFGGQELANMLWALGELRYAPSEVWMQQYWRQAAGLVQQLQAATSEAAAAAAALESSRNISSSSSVNAGSQLHQQDEAANEVQEAAQQLQLAQQQLHASMMHVCMVLQAAGRLGLAPPEQWLQAACTAVADAAASQQLLAPQQQQQQQRLLTVAVYGLSRLQLQQKMSSSSSSRSLLCTTAAQQLLRCLGLAVPSDTAEAAAAAAAKVPSHLPSMDVLLLLAALPGLCLPSHSTAAVAVPLLARAQQLLTAGCFGSSQVVQLAVAAAAVLRDITIAGSLRQTASHAGQNTNTVRAVLAGSGSSRMSSRMSGNTRLHEITSGRAVWAAVDATTTDLQQPGQTTSSSSSSSAGDIASCSAVRFTDVLASQLQLHCSGLTAAELAASLTALAQLHNSSSRSSKSSLVFRKQQRAAGAAAACPDTAAFVAAAGQAFEQHMASMHAGTRAAAAAGLARLGYCPSWDWLEGLLLHSSCQWEHCSNGHTSNLLASLPLLLSNNRQQQQQDDHEQGLETASGSATAEQSAAAAMLAAALSSMAPAATQGTVQRVQQQQQQRQQQQHVREWCQSWLDESEGRLASFTPKQLAASAAALQQLAAYCCGQPVGPHGMQRMQLQWWQQRSRRQLLTPGWRRAYCRAVLLLLPELDAADFVRLVAAAVALQMRPGRKWCVAVAREAAARADASTAALTADSSSSSSSSRELQVHHVGLLAQYLTQLGFDAYPSKQQQLLQFVKAAGCSSNKAQLRSGSSRRRVKPARLQRAVHLLRRAGWPVEPAVAVGV